MQFRTGFYAFPTTSQSDQKENAISEFKIDLSCSSLILFFSISSSPKKSSRFNSLHLEHVCISYKQYGLVRNSEGKDKRGNKTQNCRSGALSSGIFPYPRHIGKPGHPWGG